MSVTIDDMSAQLGQKPTEQPTPVVQPPQATQEVQPETPVEQPAPAEGQAPVETQQDAVPELSSQMAEAVPPEPVPKPITAGVAVDLETASLPVMQNVPSFQRVRDVAGLATTTPSQTLPDFLPSYRGMSKNLSPNLTAQERKQELTAIRSKVGDAYRRGIFHRGVPQIDSAFDNFLSQTVQVRIPILGPDGQPQKDKNGRFRYSQVIKFKPGENDDTKLIKIMEYSRNPNGVFHFFRAGDAANPLQINMNDRLAELTAPKQEGFVVGPAMRFVARVEGSEGGGSFYDAILKDDVKDPSRRLYYLRSNAKAGPFGSIRKTRLLSSMADVYPGLANLGMIGTNYIDDITLSGPMYAIASVQDALNWATGKDGQPDYTEVTKLVLPGIKDHLAGNGAPLFMLTAERVAKAYGISVDEATTVLSYDADLYDVARRMTLETLVAAPGVGAIFRQASKSVADNFGKFIFRKLKHDDGAFEYGAGDPRAWTMNKGMPDRLDWNKLQEVMEKEGVGLDTLFNVYINEMGKTQSRKWIERALDLDFAMAATIPGKFKDSFTQGVMDDLATKVFDLDQKIAKELDYAKPNQEKLDLWRSQIASYNKEMLMIKRKSHIPQYTRDFFKDEAIGLGAASLAYTLVANMSDSIEAGYIGSFVAVLASVNPRVRRKASEKYEDMRYALREKVLGIEAPSEYAITLRRRIQDAPPGLREQISMHLESVIEAQEQMRGLRYEDGTPIISEDSLQKGFAAMGTIASIENLRAQHLNSALNVRQDIGKFSTELAAVEAQTQSAIIQLDEMADAVRELRNYKLDPNLYDPNSSLGKQADAIIDFYDSQLAKLEQDRKDLDNILKEKEVFAKGLIAGLKDEETVRQFVTGERSLREAIAVDLQRFKMTEIPEDASPDEAAELLQNYLTTLQDSLAEAAELNTVVNNAQRANGTANRQFVRMIEQEELTAFTEASNYFDKLRYDFKDARFDITAVEETIDGQNYSIFDQLYLGQLDFDDDVVAMLPISAQGTFESRKIAGLTIPGDLINNMNRLFGRSAKEYMDWMMSDPARAEKVTQILKSAGEGDELLNARPIEQFIALREVARNNPSPRSAEMMPRLGLQADEFMHLVSALGGRAKGFEGKTGAVKIAQLRERILTSGETNFYEKASFYGPMSARQTVDFSGRYTEAREAYRNIYIKPWREESTSVKRFIKYSEGQKTTDMKFLNNFVKEFQLDKRLTDVQLEEGVMKVLMDMNGGKPIDINTPFGKQLRSVFTLQVLESMANYTGGKEFNRVALGGLKEGGSPIISIARAQDYAQLSQDMRAGRVKPESGINIANIMRLKDKDGNPLVDMSIINNAYSLEEVQKIAPEMVQAAKAEVSERVTKRREVMLEAFDDVTSDIRTKYDQRLELVTRLNAKKGGLGNAFIDLSLQEDGLAKIDQLEADMVALAVSKGQSEEQARNNFRQNIKDSVMEALFEQITKPGHKILNRQADEMDNNSKNIVRAKEIDPEALLQKLGFVGEGRTRTPVTIDSLVAEQMGTETSPALRKKVEKEIRKSAKLAEDGKTLLGEDGKPLYKWTSTPDTFTAERMRYLLGDEVYDHAKLIADTLYSPSLESGTPFSITGIAMPVSIESRLSKITSYLRGVISLRWLVSEAAIREALNSQFELTKILLFNPDVGKDLLKIIRDEEFTVDRFVRVEEVLLTEIARNDAIQQYTAGLESYDPDRPERGIRTLIEGAKTGVSNVQSQAQGVVQQMQNLF